MFEHRLRPLLPWPAFRARMLRAGGLGLALIVVSLVVGTLGYHHYSKPQLSWSAAFENAAMILSGMGPVDNPNLESTSARIFAGLYALYSGLALISIAGIIFAPAFHRFLHRFHLDDERLREKRPPPPLPPA